MSGASSQEGWIAGLKALFSEGAAQTAEAFGKDAIKAGAKAVEGVSGEFGGPVAGAAIGGALELGVSGTENVLAYLDGKKSGGAAIVDTLKSVTIGAASGAVAGAAGGIAGGLLGVGGEAVEPAGGGLAGPVAAGLVGVVAGTAADLELNKIADSGPVKGFTEGLADKLDGAWDAITGGGGEAGGAQPAPAAGSGGGGAPADAGASADGGAPPPADDQE